VIEDCEALFGDKNAVALLRAALHSQDDSKPMKRRLTWSVRPRRLETIFVGGIIITANTSINHVPALVAIKTRIGHFELKVSPEQVHAKMRHEALKGFTFGDDCMTPRECRQVVDFLIAKQQEAKLDPDLRLLKRAYRYYLHWVSSSKLLHGKDLIETALREDTDPVPPRWRSVNWPGWRWK
jgi:hypothetical protein